MAMVLHSPVGTPPALWTGGLQVIGFKVKPAVTPSTGVVHAPPTAGAMLRPYGSRYTAKMRCRSSGECPPKSTSKAGALDAVNEWDLGWTYWPHSSHHPRELQDPKPQVGPQIYCQPVSSTLPPASGTLGASSSGWVNGENTWVVTNGQLSFASGVKCGVWQPQMCTTWVHYASPGWLTCRSEAHSLCWGSHFSQH